MGVFINFCAGVNEEILPAAHVDAILVNVPQNLNNEVALVRTRHMLATAGTTHVMVDSGGFQFFSMEEAGGEIGFDPYRPLIYRPLKINLAPAHIIDAAVKLRPSVVTGLDWPVRKLVKKFDRDAEFMRKFGYNVKWMQDMAILRARRCPDIPLFLPIQCYDLEQLKFYETYLRDLPYDGLSLPTRNLDPSAIILLLMKFYSMGVRKVHLLSVSNLVGIAVACYFARIFFDWCSVDATTWRTAGQYGSYLDPNSLKKKRFDPGNRIPLSSICGCPWCSYRTSAQFLDMPQSDQTSFLHRHNYFVIQKAGRDCWEHSNSAHDLGRHLISRVGAQDRNVNRLVQALTTVGIIGNSNININVLKDLLAVKF